MPHSVEEIKALVEKRFSQIIKTKENLKIKGIINPDAYGHSAGTPIEEWVREHIEKETDYKVFYPNELLLIVFKSLKEKGKIIEFLEDIWWGKLLFTKEQLVSFLLNKGVKRWQQEGADLVLFYGTDIMAEPHKIVLINVKSHESSRQSRAPNIMSAQRLLEFFEYTLAKEKGSDILDEVELWFLGVTYDIIDDEAKVNGVAIKDLFKLDVAKIPQINFDAAIQIQWHVEDMKEIKQTKQQFVLSLTDEFLKRWTHHSKSKQAKYEELVKNIKDKLT